jgi:hypothetical protein
LELRQRAEVRPHEIGVAARTIVIPEKAPWLETELLVQVKRYGVVDRYLARGAGMTKGSELLKGKQEELACNPSSAELRMDVEGNELGIETIEEMKAHERPLRK